MRKKAYRGFNTGNTIRRIQSFVQTTVDRRDTLQTEGLVVASIRHHSDLDKIKFDGFEFHDDLPYSLKKKQRWRLRDYLSERLDDDNGPFYNDEVQIAEGNVIGVRGPRTRYLLRKTSGDNGEIRECEAEHGYIKKGLEEYRMNCQESHAARLRGEYADDDTTTQQESKFGPQSRCLHFDFTTAVRPEMLDRFAADLRYMKLEYVRDSDDCSNRRRARKRRRAAVGPHDYAEDYADDDVIDADVNQQQALDAEREQEEEALGAPRPSGHAVPLEDLAAAATAAAATAAAVRSRDGKRRRRRRSQRHSASSDEAAARKSRKVVLADDGDAGDADQEPEGEADRTIDLADEVEMSAVRHRFEAAAVAPRRLAEEFGGRYAEGGSRPRRFALSIGEAVQRLVAAAGRGARTRTDVFLVFEAVHEAAGAVTCDLFLNADVQGVPALSLSCLPAPADGRDIAELGPLVKQCAAAVASSYGASLRHRQVPTVVRFSGPPSLLSGRAQEGAEEALVTDWPGRAEAEGEGGARGEQAALVADVNGNLSCGICFEAVVPADAVSGDDEADLLPGGGLRACGHVFCDGCWRLHLIASIRRGRPRLQCPHSGCDAPVDMATALRFVSLPVYAPHRARAETDAVDMDRRMHWCPGPQCARAVRLERPPSSGRPVNVTCSCGHAFCFLCLEEAHWPASCEAYRRYKAKMRRLGDVETLNGNDHYLEVKGKNCPKCRKFIEKNGGCPHMTCVCGCDFCWNCGHDYDDHDYDCFSETSEMSLPKTHGITEEVTTPSQVRSRDYSNSLRWRFHRLHVRLRRDFQLSRVQLAGLVRRQILAAGSPDHGRLQQRVARESEAVARRYHDLMRLTEFSHVAVMSLSKAHAQLAARLRFQTWQLSTLVTEIRDTVNNRQGEGDSRATAKDLDEQFRLARDVVRRVRKYFVATLADEAALCSIF